MKSFFQSLRWRLQAWNGLLLFLVVAGSAVPAYRLGWNNQMQRIDKELSSTERNLVRSMMDAVQTMPEGQGSNPERVFLVPSEFIRRLTTRSVSLPPSTLDQFKGNGPGHAYFRIQDREDRILLESENAPPDIAFLPLPRSDIVEETRSFKNRREIARSSSHGLKIVVGRDITPELQEMRRIAWLHWLIGLAVWLFGLLGGWGVSGRAIRPIRTISQTASRIAEGSLQERIDVTAMDTEMGQLSQVLNQTFDRLHSAFERQRQFTADASHELRTPITILLSETQRTLKRERTPEEYREALQTCGETAQRMRRLVEALLLLARQENDSAQAHHEDCDLAVILHEVIHQLQPLADERGLKLGSSLLSVPLKADPAGLAILATNLISNALQHGGNVEVSCCHRDEQAVFTITDDGPGIAEADLPHIFDRFYRADQARTGSTGHTGLGLAIAKAIVENHGGTIQVIPRAGQGACFEVSLPVG